MLCSYDLTHVEGMTKALVDYTEWNPSRAAIVLRPFMPFLPEEILGPSFSETILAMVHAFWAHSMETAPAQKTTAIEFIEMGKKIGACKLSITLHPEAGAAIGKHLDGIPLKILHGPEGAVMVEVEYHHLS